jgi:hypothetical protein
MTYSHIADSVGKWTMNERSVLISFDGNRRNIRVAKFPKDAQVHILLKWMTLMKISDSNCLNVHKYSYVTDFSRF